MNESPHSALPPGFEEFQRQMQEFMRQNFRGMNTGNPPPPPAPPLSHMGGGAPEAKAPTSEDFKFDYRPRDVKNHLDRFVIQQEEAKKVLSVAQIGRAHV